MSKTEAMVCKLEGLERSKLKKKDPMSKLLDNMSKEFSQEGLVYQNPEWVIKEEGGMEMVLMQENNINMNSLNTSNVVYPTPPKTELPGCQMPKNI